MALTMPTVLIEQAFAIAAEQFRRDEKLNREAGTPSTHTVEKLAADLAKMNAWEAAKNKPET